MIRADYQVPKRKNVTNRAYGVLALWTEVLILALIDWQNEQMPFALIAGESCYTTQPPKKQYKSPHLDRSWFSCQHCQNIVEWIGPAGLKAARFFFIAKSHLPEHKRQKILYLIDELEYFC
jgi:hypothetical protein